MKYKYQLTSFESNDTINIDNVQALCIDRRNDNFDKNIFLKFFNIEYNKLIINWYLNFHMTQNFDENLKKWI